MPSSRSSIIDIYGSSCWDHVRYPTPSRGELGAWSTVALSTLKPAWRIGALVNGSYVSTCPLALAVKVKGQISPRMRIKILFLCKRTYFTAALSSRNSV